MSMSWGKIKSNLSLFGGRVCFMGGNSQFPIQFIYELRHREDVRNNGEQASGIACVPRLQCQKSQSVHWRLCNDFVGFVFPRNCFRYCCLCVFVAIVNFATKTTESETIFFFPFPGISISPSTEQSSAAGIFMLNVTQIATAKKKQNKWTKETKRNKNKNEWKNTAVTSLNSFPTVFAFFVFQREFCCCFACIQRVHSTSTQCITRWQSDKMKHE